MRGRLKDLRLFGSLNNFGGTVITVGDSLHQEMISGV